MDAELPLFGVCYGHQLMAHALGGRVDYLPGGREIGTQPIEMLPAGVTDSLTHRLPASFRAHTTHEQSVLEAPPGAAVLARSARDPHQMLSYGPNAVSVQFHPEFNAEVMRAYIRRKHRRSASRRRGSVAGFPGRGGHADRPPAAAPLCAPPRLDWPAGLKRPWLHAQPRKRRAMASRENKGKDQPEQEATDMRPPDVGAIARARIAEQQLQQHPDADQQERRHANEFEIQAQRQHKPEPGPREQCDVGAHDGRHGAAAADDRQANALQ